MTSSISSKEILLPVTGTQDCFVMVGCEVDHIWIPLESDTHEIRIPHAKNIVSIQVMIRDKTYEFKFCKLGA